MLEHFNLLTLTHKRVPLAQLGGFVLHAETPLALGVRLHAIKEQFGLHELLYLATCNRVLFFYYGEKKADLPFLTEFFQELYPGIEESVLDQLDEWVAVYQGQEAIRHLFEVAASIDSMVIGERQILGQLRDAYDQCRDWGITGDNLRLAVDLAVQAAKAVYTHTRIGEKPVSIASLAVQKLERLHTPKDARILMVGAGQTNALVAKFLIKHQFHNVRVFNRTMARAEDLSSLFQQGSALPLSALPAYRDGFDVLIACTSAHEPVIRHGLYQDLLHGDQREKVVIDLSIPHNVEPAVPREFPVQYVEIEGLRSLAKENLAFREKEVEHARKLLEEYTALFPAQYRQRRLERALQVIPDSVRAVKEKAVREVFKKELETLDPSAQALVERILGYMEKKCIGIPMKAAREAIL